MLQASLQLYRKAYSGIPKPVWWLSLVILVNRAGTMVIPFLTVYLTHKGYTLTEAGMVMATFGIGAVLGGFLGGQLTDRLGSFYVQLFSLFLNGVFFMVLGYLQALWSISLCVFLMSSIGEAFRPANAAAIAAFSTERNRTRCYSLNRLAINLGWSIGPAVGGILASLNYHLLFWVDGITCMIAAALLYCFLDRYKIRVNKEEKEKGMDGTTSAYKDRLFLQAMFFLMLIGICFFQLFNFIPVYYRDYVGLSEWEIGWVLALNGLIIALVEMILVYKLENRQKPLLYMLTGAFLIGGSFIILSVAPSLHFVLLSMLFITFGEMLLFPFTNNFWVSRTTAQNRGRYAAVYTITFAVAQIIAPLMASSIALGAGFTSLFIIDFLLCCIAAFGFLWLRKSL